MNLLKNSINLAFLYFVFFFFGFFGFFGFWLGFEFPSIYFTMHSRNIKELREAIFSVMPRSKSYYLHLLRNWNITNFQRDLIAAQLNAESRKIFASIVYNEKLMIRKSGFLRAPSLMKGEFAFYVPTCVVEPFGKEFGYQARATAGGTIRR